MSIISRVEIINEKYEREWRIGPNQGYIFKLEYQDDGQTLKIFMKKREQIMNKNITYTTVKEQGLSIDKIIFSFATPRIKSIGTYTEKNCKIENLINSQFVWVCVDANIEVKIDLKFTNINNILSIEKTFISLDQKIATRCWDATLKKYVYYVISLDDFINEYRVNSHYTIQTKTLKVEI